MKDIVEEKILEDASLLVEGCERVLLAVSGGADSVAMAHALVTLRKRGCVSCEFVIGHVNHGLRGSASDADERFVRAMAQSLDVPVVTKSVDVKDYAKEHKLSIETAGRIVRLKTLAEMAKVYQCDCVATAHHRDDLAETIVHRLMRGTGFRGLCGIRAVSSIGDTTFIRPMLSVRRDEIVRYCREGLIRWRDDASNRDLGFTRNRIRHQLMPFLEAESCEIVNKLRELSQQCCRFQLFTEKRAQRIVAKGRFDAKAGRFSIDQELLKDAARWVFYEVVREVLVKLGIGLRPYTRAHFDTIGKLIGKKRTRRILPNGLIVSVTGKNLVFLKSTQVTAESVYPQKPVRLDMGAAVEFGPWRISCRILKRADVDMDDFINRKDSQVEWFDADKISGAIEVRARLEGDRFRPIGSKGEKKVARFLQDAQIPPEVKKEAFIVADSDKILWLAPIRMSEGMKVSPQTDRICEVGISAMSGNK